MSAMATVQTLIREEVLALSAYQVPDARGLVKLDAMENPYPLPAALAEELGHLLARAPVNRYPDADAKALKAAIRRALPVPGDCDILLGNGSDEIIQLLALAVAKPGAVLASVEPTFVMFRMIATFTGLRHVACSLRSDFTLDVEAVLALLERERPALLFLATPNNPTGNAFARADIERIARAVPGLLVIDEAYYAFGDTSHLDLAGLAPNVLVMRTFSKLGLAGLRLGFLVGPKHWLEQVDKLRLPYNVNVLTQRCATRLLESYDQLAAQAEAIRVERGELERELAEVRGVEVFASEANFLLFRIAGAAAVFDGLVARGVLIKNVSRAHSLLADCLRVTVGTRAENTRFLAALRETVAV
ncbi:MAG: histidinol-phosphate transaminase [Proteobacteria bacterium]|nr:histidinol-phosphate transaminase [Burkholderiales bacterium]